MAKTKVVRMVKINAKGKPIGKVSTYVMATVPTRAPKKKKKPKKKAKKKRKTKKK